MFLVFLIEKTVYLIKKHILTYFCSHKWVFIKINLVGTECVSRQKCINCYVERNVSFRNKKKRGKVNHEKRNYSSM